MYFVQEYINNNFLAACTQHSGDWLFALPVASCGLQLDDEAVRVAVGLRLGWTCARHTNVVVVQWLMLEASIALFTRRHPARQSDTIL